MQQKFFLNTWVLFLFLIFFSSCQAHLSSIPVTDAPHLIVADENATATPTPFQPLETTPTWTPTVTLTPTLTPTITFTPVYSATPIPTETQMPWYDHPDISDNLISILLLGSDKRPGQGFHTDIIVLVTINPRNQKIAMISFPRDLYVTIPGWGYNRINVIQSLGGFDLLAQTFEQNFGIRPQYYALVEFNGFVDAIDAIGGINVNVEKSIRDQCDVAYVSVRGYCSFDPGWHEMNGPTALWYVRSRHTTSDFERTQRTQEVLKALLNRVVGIDGGCPRF